MYKKFFAVGLALVVSLATGFVTAASAEGLSGTLKQIKDSGTFVIGARETSIPFSYLDQNQHYVGYSIDLCMRVADAIKKQLNMPKLKVKFVPDNPVNRIPLIVNHTTELECGSSTNTLRREQQVSFALTTL